MVVGEEVLDFDWMFWFGKYVLVLQDKQGKVFDSVCFEVRGVVVCNEFKVGGLVCK